ncbi:unnamed protein product [Coccothraustes coccothraustes]
MGRYVFLTRCRKSCASCRGTQHFPALSVAGPWRRGSAAGSNLPGSEPVPNPAEQPCAGSRLGRTDPPSGAPNSPELRSSYLRPFLGAMLCLLAGAEPTVPSRQRCCC